MSWLLDSRPLRFAEYFITPRDLFRSKHMALDSALAQSFKSLSTLLFKVMPGSLNIEDVKNLILGQWQLDDGRQIEFIDEVNLVLTTRNGGRVTDKYFVYQEGDLIRLQLPILLSNNCIINHIDISKFRYTEPGVIGEVVLSRFPVDGDPYRATDDYDP